MLVQEKNRELYNVLNKKNVGEKNLDYG